jgi:hypothetical protein
LTRVRPVLRTWKHFLADELRVRRATPPAR